jgi:transcriptional regulator of acetoin/glycerol metabolism
MVSLSAASPARAQAQLARYHWPGNVRELENVLGNACMMAEGNMIDTAELPPHLKYSAECLRTGSDGLVPLDEMQRRHTLHVLETVKGNKTKAAGILGISRATLYRLLETPARARQQVG